MEKKKSKNKAVLVIGLILLIASVTFGVLIMTGVIRFSPEKTEDAQGVVGRIKNDWDTGLEESDQTSKRGTKIPGYSTAEMNAGDKTLKISIGNPKENKVGLIATLKLSDGTVLYKSTLLKPGQGLEEVPLTQTLEKGEYAAMVAYQCVMLDEKNTPLNGAESGFELIVK